MHEWVKRVYALGSKKAVANGARPHPSRPAGLQNLFGTADVMPEIDQRFGPLRHIPERRLGTFVPLCLCQDHCIQGTDGYAGDFAEIAVAVNDEVVDRACLERSFEATPTEHQGALLLWFTVVEGFCRLRVPYCRSCAGGNRRQ